MNRPEVAKRVTSLIPPVAEIAWATASGAVYFLCTLDGKRRSVLLDLRAYPGLANDEPAVMFIVRELGGPR